MKKFALLLACTMLCTTVFASCAAFDLNGTETQDTETQDTEAQDTKAEYAPGTSTETGYSGEWIGLEFTPVGNMVMATREELDEAMNIGADIVGIDAEEIDWSKVTSAYEMMATDVVTGSNVIVIAEKLAFKNITMEQYIAALKLQFEDAENIAVTFGEASEFTLAGETHTRIDVTTKISGFTISQTMLLRKIEDRMICINITAVNEGDEEVFLSCFKAK